jgi:hypothetical protein
MPTWGEILKECNAVSEVLATQGGQPVSSQFDIVRRKYLAKLSSITERPVVVYATAWMASPVPNISPDLISIGPEDIHGFMEATHEMPKGPLDIILHSPGGSPTAAESIVEYLRSRFDTIRIFVPHMSMSAATMISCAANEIVLGKHSFLGPIDPQLIMQTALGARSVPARAILDQFEKAQEECADPIKLRSWLPMLNQFGPDLLVQCRNATALSELLVEDWLKRFMFKNDPSADAKAREIAAWLGNHNNFLNHGRTIGREKLREHGLNIVDLESEKDIQDAVLSIFHATCLTFSSTPCVKIIENNTGKAFCKFAGLVGA